MHVNVHPIFTKRTMKKIFFNCLAWACGLLAVPFPIHAQAYRISSAPRYVAEAPACKGITMGYCTEDLSLFLGQGKVVESGAAIRLTAEMLAPYAGNKIQAIRFGQASQATDASVFIAKDLAQDPVYTKVVGNAAAGWNEVTVDYTLDGGDLYIGYFSTGYDQLALSNRYSDDGVYLYEGEKVWGNYAVVNKWDALAVQVVIDGQAMPAAALMFDTVDDRYFSQVDEAGVVTAVVKNMTTTVAKSYDVAFRLGEASEQVVAIKDRAIEANGLDTFSIEIPAIKEVGVVPLHLSLKSVNGTENKITYNTRKEVEMECKRYVFPRKVVVEEGTGTWCQFCVRGIVGMREMKKRYPDSFIGIVVHSGDPMAASSYGALESRFFKSGLPNCVFNRDPQLRMDPNLDNLERTYKQISRISDIGVKASAGFASVNENTIKITTSTTFGFTSDAVAYRFAFVLLEDSVHSTLNGYGQANAYSPDSGSPYAGVSMGGFENLPPYIPAEDMYYEHVARGIYKSFEGTLNSVPYQVTEGETYTYSYEIDATSYRRAKVLDKTRLAVVALLIDTNTGQIVNADKVDVKLYDASSIEETPASECRVYAEDGMVKADGEYDSLRVFTVDGIEVANQQLQNGVYLAQIISGKHIAVKKVWVK